MKQKSETDIADVIRPFSSVLRRAERGNRIVVRRRGEPAAVIGSIEELELIERYERELELRATCKANK